MCKKVNVFVAVIVVFGWMLSSGPVVAQDGGDQQGEKASSKESEEQDKVDPYAEFQRANKLASYNALTRSIPHYRKVIDAAPRQYPLAHFNLGEVYRVKGDCGPALVYFQAYLRVGKDEGALEDARRAIKDCTTGAKTAKLTISAKPDTAIIEIEGAIFSETGSVEELELYPGEYEISARALDYIPQTTTVELAPKGEETIEMNLVKKTYFGELKVNVDQDDATISVEPLKLDAPNSEETPDQIAFEAKSPLEKPRKLPTGKYSVEVNKENYDKWIRYVRVERDDLRTVNVKMIRSLPSEIR